LIGPDNAGDPDVPQASNGTTQRVPTVPSERSEVSGVSKLGDPVYGQRMGAATPPGEDGQTPSPETQVAARGRGDAVIAARGPAEEHNDETGSEGTDFSSSPAGPEGIEQASDKANKQPPWYSAHVQATIVTQKHNVFPSPYVGPQSLVPVEPSATSETSTVYLAARLAESTELVFDPEVIAGRGFSNVFGVAGFPNGEMNRVTSLEPTPYIARLYGRHVWGLGGAQEDVPNGFNQVAGVRDIDRVTMVVGKMAPTDFFDDNRYGHDPRTQFLDWSLMYNGAWDYPADLRGYSYGGTIDFNRQNWALRYGVFAEPTAANLLPLDPNFLQAHGHVVELEERYLVNERPGKLRLLGYLNQAHMGSYRLALAEMPVNPDITQTRAYRIKYGFCANLEQELTNDLGFFSRLGWNNGQTESWAYTEVDSSASVGLVVKGNRWSRPQDQVGLAVLANGLSAIHRAYLAAGGLGLQVGDGRLNYGLEEILETYYRLELRPGLQVSAAFQGVNNPAYNRDRGPVAIGSIRVHFEL